MSDAALKVELGQWRRVHNNQLPLMEPLQAREFTGSQPSEIRVSWEDWSSQPFSWEYWGSELIRNLLEGAMLTLHYGLVWCSNSPKSLKYVLSLQCAKHFGSRTECKNAIWTCPLVALREQPRNKLIWTFPQILDEDKEEVQYLESRLTDC